MESKSSKRKSKTPRRLASFANLTQTASASSSASTSQATTSKPKVVKPTKAQLRPATSQPPTASTSSKTTINESQEKYGCRVHRQKVHQQRIEILHLMEQHNKEMKLLIETNKERFDIIKIRHIRTMSALLGTHKEEMENLKSAKEAEVANLLECNANLANDRDQVEQWYEEAKEENAKLQEENGNLLAAMKLMALKMGIEVPMMGEGKGKSVEALGASGSSKTMTTESPTSSSGKSAKKRKKTSVDWMEFKARHPQLAKDVKIKMEIDDDDED